MDPEKRGWLTRAFLEFDADDAARVACVWRRRAFCAGWDLKYVSTLVKPSLGSWIFSRRTSWQCGEIPRGPLGHRGSNWITRIAAVAGPAVAGGMELRYGVILGDAENPYFGVYCGRGVL